MPSGPATLWAAARDLRPIRDSTWLDRLYAEASHTGDTGLYRHKLTVRKRDDELIVDNAGTTRRPARST